MNRVIKFRVWDNDTKEFLFPSEIMCFISDDKLGEFSHIYDNDGLKRFNIIFQQFTGLLDKNNKPIFEGDIVSFSYQEGSPFDYTDRIVNKTGRVYWTDCGFKVGWGYFDIRTLKFANNEDISSDYIVIGNIMENSELLEAGADLV